MGHDRLDEWGLRGSRAAQNEHRAALEALFAPKTPAPQRAATVSKRDSAKMVSAPSRTTTDARAAEQERLVARLLASAGRTAVSRAADDITRAGFALPDEQEVQLQLLEHADEERVRSAIESLARLLDGEPAKRRTVLESRLRRIEDCADEAITRELGADLRRKLGRSLRPL
jgi:glycerol-3-phosphate O-acyltransferase